MLVRILILTAAALAILGSSPNHKSSKTIGSRRSILTINVDSFRIENGDMEDALRALRQKDPPDILIGFEEVARVSGERGKTFSMSFSHATVGKIIRTLCQQDPSYSFEVIQDRLLHVYPVNHGGGPARLLRLRVADFSVDGKMAPAAIIERMPALAPELASYLHQKRDKFLAARGIVPGSPGANMTGNMDPPVHLDLRDLTVEDILNSVVLYSQQLYRQSRPDSTGYRIPPTSWIYKFIVDPNATTGLGGTPQWIAF